MVDVSTVANQVAAPSQIPQPTPPTYEGFVKGQQESALSSESQRSSEIQKEEPDIGKRKNWSEINVDPKFRAMSPSERNNVADAYFDENIAPQIKMQYSLNTARLGVAQDTDSIISQAKNQFKNSIQIDETSEKSRLPDVDYLSGIGSIGTLYDYTNASNDRERLKALTRTYGRDNVKLDPGGRFYIQTPGGKVAVIGTNNKFQQMLAEAGSGSPAMAGFIASSFLMPEITLPAKLVPEVAPALGVASKMVNKAKGIFASESGESIATQKIGERAMIAGAGGATGQGSSDVVKELRGLSDKSVKEEIEGLKREALDSVMASATFDSTLYPFGEWARMMHARKSSPEEKQLAKEALDMGLRPSVAQLRQQTKGANLWNLEQKFIEGLTGRDAKAVNSNMQIVGKMVDDQLKSMGMSESEVPVIKSKIFNKQLEPMKATEDATQFATRMGDRVKRAVEDHVEETEKLLNKRTEELLKSSSGDTHAALEADVEKAVGDARSQLSSVAKQKYGVLESDAKTMLPEGLSASNSPLKSFAIEEKKNLLRQKPGEGKKIGDIYNPEGDVVSTIKASPKGEGDVDVALKSIENQLDSWMKLPDRIPISQLENYRKAIWEKANANTITPDTNKGFWMRAYKAVNATVESMESDPYLMSKLDPAQTGGFVKKLKETRSWYKGEIEKFDRVSINKMARDAGTTGAWQEGRMADMLIRPNNAEMAASIKKVIPSKIWDRIAAIKLNDIFNKSTVNGKIDVENLANSIKSYTDSDLKEFFGAKKASEIRELGKQAYSIGGHLDPKFLDESNLSEAIRAAKAAKLSADKYTSENLIRDLSAGGRQAESAMTSLVNMNSLSDLKKARSFFGPHSKEWQSIEQNAMIQFLSEGMNLSESGFQKINGAAWQNAFERRSYESMKEMWGKDVAEGLQKIVKWARYTGDEQRLSGAGMGMAIMGVALHIPSHIPLFLAAPYVAGLYRSPLFIQWVTLGLEGKSIPAQAAAKFSRMAMYEFLKAVNNTLQITQDNTVPGYIPMGGQQSEWNGGQQNNFTPPAQ